MHRAGDSPGVALPSSQAAERNKRPILEVLKRVLPASGTLLEIASGTGQHAVHFAAELPGLRIQPSEADPELIDVIRRRRLAAALTNVEPPLELNVLDLSWPIERADAMLAVNLLHIAPWAVTTALLRGAAATLVEGGHLIVYGPFKRAEAPTAPSNAAFDAQLKARDPRWGLRLVENVAAEANRFGLSSTQITEMPANNLTLVFRRAGQPRSSISGMTRSSSSSKWRPSRRTSSRHAST